MCPGSKALSFNQSDSFANAPKINLYDSSFTISCWIKQTKRGRMGAIYGDWHYPHGQFLLSIANQRLIFYRQSAINRKWLLLQSAYVSLRDWTHVVVTWYHTTRIVLIYANGKEIGRRTYCPREVFYGPTGKPYMIGNDGLKGNHQFHGSVMDLYVFDKALSLDEINMLRGERLMSVYCSSEKIQTFLDLYVKCLNYKDFYTQREKYDGAKNSKISENKQ